MSSASEALSSVTRRHFFRRAASASAALALLALLEPDRFGRARAAADPLAPRPPHFAPKAKSVIYLFMAGGPVASSTCSTTSRSSQELPRQADPRGSFIKGKRFAFIKGTPKLLGSPVRVRPARPVRGRGSPSCCPHLGDASPTTSPSSARCTPTQFNHAPAKLFMNTGRRSSAGRAWARG